MSAETPKAASNQELSPLQQSYFVIRKLKERLEAVERQRDEPIAIIGAGCRLPGGVNDLESYWRLLRDGVDAVKKIPAERWDVDAFFDPDPAAPEKSITRCAGVVDAVDQFDPLFFGISPREAVSLDPQQRLLLEVTWEALERACLAPDRLVAERTGAFVGIGQMDYAQLLLGGANGGSVDIYAGTGNGFCFASGRLSYSLGLRGPNLAIDTACSSSLVSVHLACQSLRARECDLALAGGVQLMLSPKPFVGLSKLGALSPDGRCKTFDATANGYGRGEGCGMVVLKRLSDALTAGDSIAAVIRGSAVNHDGASSGFTVPNGLAQQELLRRALTAAGVKASELGYVEAHGTGTQLGDPIEVEALSEVFGRDRSPDAPLIIGSVKTNIGHLESAAGIAGLLKTVLALQHREIPPHLHVKRPNPHIRWNGVPVAIATGSTAWKPSTEKRLAGVSAFGLSGTNAHVILEEAPLSAPREPFLDRPQHVLPLSARTTRALTELAASHEAWIVAHPDASVGDFCFTCAKGRSHHSHRAAFVGASLSEMREQLATFAVAPRNQQDGAGERPRTAFLFSGQGSQYVGMGRSLYNTQPSFRATLDRCDELLRPYLDVPLLDILYSQNGTESPLHDTGYTQPALFALEYALAQLWISWGVEPDVMMGHSIGEYVAACVAGVFSLDDGVKLVAHRARLMQALPAGGAMAVVFADQRTVASVIQNDPSRIAIAALNGDDNIVISGASDVVARVTAELEKRGIRSTPLQVSHAFHSPLMDPMLAEFARVAREIRYLPPRRALVSNLEGKPAGAEIATPEYWVEHVRRPVRFGAGLTTLDRLGYTVFIEAGPKPALLAMARRSIPNPAALWLPSLSQGIDDWRQLLSSVAKVYERGARIDWAAFDRDYDRRPLIVPTYPFQRQRYWIEPNGHRDAPVPPTPGPGSIHPFLGARLRLPLSNETRFETRFTATSPAYLQEHRLFDTMVVPGASHIAMILCAAKEALGSESCVLEDVFFPQALVLDEKSGYTVQAILSPEADAAACRVVSLSDDGDARSADAWTVHFTARMTTAGANAPSSSDLDGLRARCPHELPAAEFYSMFTTAGYGLGPAFRWLGSIWQGDGEALARIEVPSLPDRLESYELYPGLIDSCFQLFAACWRGRTVQSGGDEIFVPFTIGQFHCYRGRPTGDLWCHTRIRNPSETGGSLTVDIQLFDGKGRLVAKVARFEGRKASRKALLRSLHGDLSDALYELRWQPSLPAQPVTSEPSDRDASWMIFSDGTELSSKLIELLTHRGHRCIVVEPGSTFGKQGAHYILNPHDQAEFERVLRETPPVSAIVHLWPETASGFHLVRALAGSASTTIPRLFIVTRAAVAAGQERMLLNLEQAPLWGLGRVVALENPELRCTRIDLDSSPRDDDADALVQDMLQPSLDDQIVIRSGQRLVPRLARLGRAAHTTDRYKLTMQTFGILDELRMVPMARRRPGPGEVEINVRTTALNLRDVVTALGMLTEDLRKFGITNAADISFGFECAGEITAVGDGITRFKPGDEVMGFSLGGMNSHVVVNAALIMPKPADMSFEEAATIPAAYASAYLSLHHFAQLRAGERVLIHAAAGGVGQAAVQMARNVGAEIFATASPGKWEFLKAQGIRYLMNSRTTEFAEQIKELTGGRGVDCVVNSLSGEFIPKSLDTLAANGRFVELGRIGIWDEAQVHQVRPDVAYFNFDLARICLDDLPRIASLIDALKQELERKTFRSLPYTVFSVEDAAAAFRFMAQAKHTGKVVLAHARPERVMIREDAAYVITGGLGALGCQLAEWMVSKGARNLVLSGRSNPTPAAAAVIARMHATGATVSVVQGDVSQAGDVERMLEEARRLGPVRGIVHAAGVLDDGILATQDWARFRRVMAPKVDGGWHLHRLSEGLPLDFFICYSSIASLLGSPGQGNYAAANAYLDALAHHRRALGLPALAINWGAWDGAGMATLADARARARWGAHGLGLIPPDQALDLLEQLWIWDVTQVGVQPVNWAKFMSQMPVGVAVPLLEAFAGDGAIAPAKSTLIEALEAAPPDERLTLLQDEIRGQIANVLGLPSYEDIELRGRLFDLGLDSLMAVELKTRLERAVGCAMRPTLVFDYPTVEALAGYFAQAPLAALFTPANSESPGDDDAAVEEESEAAIAEQLANELSELEEAGGR